MKIQIRPTQPSSQSMLFSSHFLPSSLLKHSAKRTAHGVKSVSRKLFTAFCLLPSPYSLWPSVFLLTAFCILPTPFCLLSFCLLLTAFCLLPSAYCLLSFLLTAYCLLSFAMALSRSSKTVPPLPCLRTLPSPS